MMQRAKAQLVTALFTGSIILAGGGCHPNPPEVQAEGAALASPEQTGTPAPIQEVEVELQGPRGVENGKVRFELDNPMTPDGSLDGAVRIDLHNQSKGNEDAPVTWIVFVGWNCPFSGKLVETLQAMQTRYPDTLRIVFKYVSLPNDEKGRAWASRAILQESERFWRQGMRALRVPLAERGSWEEFGLIAELSEAEEKEANIRLEMDQALAERLKIRSTPQSIVNGKRMTGAKSPEIFDRMIQAALPSQREAKP